MAHQLTGQNIKDTFEQLWYRGTTVPGGTTNAIQLLTSENDQTDDIGTALYIGTQRIGIGTASPNYLLDVEGTGAQSMRIYSSDNDAALIIASDTDEGQVSKVVFAGDTAAKGSILYNHNTTQGNQNMRFVVGDDSITAVTIEGDGKVGIGTTSPEGLLHLYSETTGRPWITIEHKGSAGEQSGTLYFKTRETGGYLNDDVVIGNIEFASYDNGGTAYRTSAMIRSFAKATQANNQAGGNLTFWTNNDTTSPLQRMTIAETGNVGIGTTLPRAALDVHVNAAFSVTSSSTAHNLRLSRDATAGAGNFGGSIAFSAIDVLSTVHAGIAWVQSGSDADQGGLAFFHHGGPDPTDNILETMRINSAGFLGIGHNNPNERLHIDGHSGDAAIAFSVGDGTGAASYCLGIDNSDGDKFKIHSGADIVDASDFTIDTAGKVGIGTASPSYPLEVQSAAALRSIYAVNTTSSGVTYGMVSESEGSATTNVGLLAKASGATNNYGLIVSAGDVGLGIAAPKTRLHLLGQGAANGIFFERTSSNGFGIYNHQVGSVETMKFAHTGDAFASDTDVKMVLTEAGLVGLGTITPADYYAPELVVVASDNGGITIANGAAHAGGIFWADGVTSGTAADAYRGQITYDHANNSMQFATDTTARMTISSAGAVAVVGALSKGSGSFKIDHPIPSMKATHNLVHSFVESPKADLIYRGTVDLVSGSATVNIDIAAGMTEGTFVLLCDDVQCFTTNESNWDLVKGSVSGNILTLESENTDSTASISWMVIGDRKDEHIMGTEWTDENGKPIIEPLKENNNKQGDSNNEQEEQSADSGDNGGDASGESSGEDSGGAEGDSSDSAGTSDGESASSESSSDDSDESAGSSGSDASDDSEAGSGGDDSSGSLPEGEPSDGWTKEQLKAYMDVQDPAITYNSGDTKQDLLDKIGAF